MLRRLLKSACSSLLGLAVAPMALAQAVNIDNVASFEILTGYRTAAGTHMAAARIVLQPGWKTYWRQPGGNGIPPQFDWSGSRNVAAVAYHWPAPTIYHDNGVRTIGYADQLILPIEVHMPHGGDVIELRGTVHFGVCKDVCIPAQARFAARLSAASPSHQATIQTALRRVPKPDRRGARCQVRPVDGGFAVTAELPGQGRLSDEAFGVIEVPGTDLWAEPVSARVSGNMLVTQTMLYSYGDTPVFLDRSQMRFTLFSGGAVRDIHGCVSG